MDKSSILKAFNNHLFEFVDDIISIFPENNDIKTTKTFFEITKKGNATLLIKIWFTYVHTPYGELLENDDLEYFVNKDYSEDMSNLSNAKDILSSIDKIRQPIKAMSDSNKEHSLKYLKNLNKLSKLYNESK
tara:strand:+ start:5160 stop:5555 length:396 start_codon:yes stop_codon:yes gene_type:complete